jgi:RNA polymerase sigma factor (sigma-70 family)
MTHHVPAYSGEHLDASETERSDAELITAVRGGDESAYGTLWSRHEHAARRLARQLGNPSNVDDLVSEAFLRVLRALKSGSGPDGAFRPYLFSTLRRINIDNGRSYYTRISLTDDDRDLEGDVGDSAADIMFDNAEGSAAWRAWNSLPDATRTLLWHLVIEEETPAQIAPLIGTTANGVSSRAVRAKERLRQAFLQQHLLDAESDGCRRARARMGEYVRNALSARDRSEVQTHLDTCASCSAALFEVSDLNQTMRVLIAPVVLGGTVLAGHYLAAVGAGATKGSIVGSLRLHHLRNPAVAATVVAAVVVAGIGSAFAFGAIDTAGTHHKPVAAAVHSAPSASSSAHVVPAPPVAPVASSVSPAPKTTAPSTSRTTPSASKTAAKPSASSPPSKVIITALPSITPPVVPPVTRESTTVTFYIDTSQIAAIGTTSLTTTNGWTITKVALHINGAPAPSDACTWTGPSPGCTLTDIPVGEQQYDVTAISPSNLNPAGELQSIYSDSNETIPGTNALGTN